VFEDPVTVTTLGQIWTNPIVEFKNAIKNVFKPTLGFVHI